MNLLKEQYRELLGKANPLGSGGFVFMAETPAAPAVAEAKPEEAKKIEEKSEEPKSPKEIQAAMESAKEALKKKYDSNGLSPAETKALDAYKAKIDATAKEYETKLNALPSPDLNAAKALEAPANSLIAEINARAESGSTETAEEVEAKDKLIKENLPLLAKRLGDATGNPIDMSNPELAKLAPDLLSKIEKGKLESSIKGNLELSAKEAIDMRNVLLKGLEPNKGKTLDKGEQDLVASLKVPDDFKKLNIDLGSKTALNERIALNHKVETVDGKTMIDGKEPDVPKWKEMLGLGADYKSEVVKDEKLPNPEGDAKNQVEAWKKMTEMANTLQQAEGPKKMGALESLTALLQLYGSLMAALKSGDYATLTDALKDFKEGKNPADSMKESRKNYTDALAKPDLPVDQLLSAYLEPRGEVANNLFVNEATPADKKESLGRYRAEAKPAILQALANGTGLTINSVTQVGDKKMVEAFDKDGQHVSIEFSGSGKGLKAEVKTYSAESKSTITKKDEKGVETTEEKITPSVKAKTGTNIIPEGEGLTLADIMKQVPNVIKNAAAPATEQPKAEEAKAKPEVTPAKSDEKEVAKK